MDNFYTSTVYRKGAEIVRKIRAIEYAPAPAPVSLNKLYDTTTLTPLPELVEQYRKFARIFRDDFGLDHPTWQEA